MANTGAYYPGPNTSHSGWNFLTLLWTSGATGAVPTGYPGSFTRSTPEVKSVTRTGTGAFTFALGAAWAGPMFAIFPYLLQATFASSGACEMVLIEDHSNNVTTPEVKVLITNAAGAAADPASGDIIGVTLATQLVSVS